MPCWPSPAGSMAGIGGPPMPDLTASTAHRRTLYGFIDRLNLPGLYRTFDFPDPNTTSPRRDQTTIAPQALFLMNHPFVIDAARSILTRPEIAVEQDVTAKVKTALRIDLRPAAGSRRLRSRPRVPGQDPGRVKALASARPGAPHGQ